MQLQPTLSRALVRIEFAIAILLTLMNQMVQALDKPIMTVENNGTKYEGLAYNVTHDSQIYIVAKFLGIPFAEFPERFAKPTLKNPEAGTQHVKTFKAICQQKMDPSDGCQKGQNMSEDCLFLNIYVPLPSYTLRNLSTLPPTTPTSPTTKTTSTTTSTSSSTTKTTSTTTSDPTTNSPSNSPTFTTKTPNSAGATTQTFATTTSKSSAADEQRDEDSADEAEVSVPALPSANESYAVLIYIHGGAYMEGAANCYDGSRLAGLGNIIVVTINYRLGPFGFLSTNDDVIPGNLGLWDQYVAIQWVSQNIHRFGGDPGRITVGGQSAGSYSSIFQGLYKENDQLFHRIIAQSGTPTASKSVSTSGYATTREVANMLNCNIEGEGKSKEIKECLMKKEAEVLAEARPTVIVPGTMAIQPTLDAPFAEVDPHKILSVTPSFPDTKKPEVPKHFTNKDLLMGVDAQDGEVVYRLFLHDNAKANLTYTINQETMAVLLKLYFQSDYKDKVDDILIEAILDRYIDWEDSDNVTILTNRAVEILTDIFFAIPALDTATSHSIPNTAADVTRQRRSARVAALRPTYRQTRDASNANNDTVKQEGTNDQVKRASTYFYRFSLPATSRPSTWFEGTPHASEIRYVFGRESLSNDEQRKISKQIMTYWTNFVKTGNPNKAMLDEATSSTSSPLPLSVPEWEEYTNTDQKYLELAPSPCPETKSELLAGARHFWSEYMPRLKRRLAEKVDRTRNDGQDCPKQRNVGDGGSRLSSGYFALCLALLVLIFL